MDVCMYMAYLNTYWYAWLMRASTSSLCCTERFVLFKSHPLIVSLKWCLFWLTGLRRLATHRVWRGKWSAWANSNMVGVRADSRARTDRIPRLEEGRERITNLATRNTSINKDYYWQLCFELVVIYVYEGEANWKNHRSVWTLDLLLWYFTLHWFLHVCVIWTQSSC